MAYKRNKTLIKIAELLGINLDLLPKDQDLQVPILNQLSGLIGALITRFSPCERFTCTNRLQQTHFPYTIETGQWVWIVGTRTREDGTPVVLLKFDYAEGTQPLIEIDYWTFIKHFRVEVSPVFLNRTKGND